MKYPGMPAAGTACESVAWQHAGSDVRRAATQLRPDDFPHGYENAIARYEIDARLGRREWTEADLTDPGPDAEPLARFALAYARYIDAIYKNRIKVARSTVEHDMAPLVQQTPDNAGYVDMARARIRRLQGRDRASGVTRARQALASFIAEDMADEAADAHRELAAVLLLNSRVDARHEALDHAQAARDTHLAHGDAYLAGYADILIARCNLAQDDPDKALDQFLAIAQQGRAIGSMELYETACTYATAAASKALHPSDARFDEVIALGEEALQLFGPQDRFSQSEVLLQIARLEQRRFEFDAAVARLDEAEMRLGEVTGGGLGVSNIAKERARIEFARAQIAPNSRISPAAVVQNPAAAARGAYHFGRAYFLLRSSGFDRFAARLRRNVIEPVIVRGGDATRLIDRLEGSDLSTETQIGVAVNHARAAAQRGDFADSLTAAEWANQGARDLRWPFAIATTSIAMAAARAGLDRQDAPDSASEAMRSLESLRVALVQPAGRSHLQAAARATYQESLAIAAQFDDWSVAIEAIERQQSERLAGALRAGSLDLDERGRDALEQLEAFDKERRVAVSAAFRGPVNRPEPRGRAKARQDLADELGAPFVELFDPEPLDVDSLYVQLDDRTHTLHLFVERAGADEIFCVWRGPDGSGQVITTPAQPIVNLAHRLLDGVSQSGWFSDVVAQDLRPFAALIPPKLAAHLGDQTEPTGLLICPVGVLWAVPFATIPIGDVVVGDHAVLVDHCDIQVSPSVRFHTSVAQRALAQGNVADSGTIQYWVDEDDQHFRGEDLSWLQRNGQPLPETNLLEHMRSREATITVLGCHGDNQPGVLHSLQKTDKTTVLRAGDLLAAPGISRVLVLAACSGGYVPGSDWAEPLGIATAALCAGAQRVIASCLPIGADSKTAEFLCTLYDELLDDTGAGIVSRAQRAWRKENPQSPLFQWAPLTELC